MKIRKIARIAPVTTALTTGIDWKVPFFSFSKTYWHQHKAPYRSGAAKHMKLSQAKSDPAIRWIIRTRLEECSRENVLLCSTFLTNFNVERNLAEFLLFRYVHNQLKLEEAKLLRMKWLKQLSFKQSLKKLNSYFQPRFVVFSFTSNALNSCECV